MLYSSLFYLWLNTYVPVCGRNGRELRYRVLPKCHATSRGAVLSALHRLLPVVFCVKNFLLQETIFTDQRRHQRSLPQQKNMRLWAKSTVLGWKVRNAMGVAHLSIKRWGGEAEKSQMISLLWRSKLFFTSGNALQLNRKALPLSRVTCTKQDTIRFCHSRRKRF